MVQTCTYNPALHDGLWSTIPTLSLTPCTPPDARPQVSLGCPKNTVDSEVMLGNLERSGFSVVDDHESADAIVINTCAFVEDAKAESLDVRYWRGLAGRECLLCTVDFPCRLCWAPLVPIKIGQVPPGVLHHPQLAPGFPLSRPSWRPPSSRRRAALSSESS